MTTETPEESLGAASRDAETFVPHLGWLNHSRDEELATFLNQGWFEYREAAFLWLYLRDGDTVLDCGAHIGLYSLLASKIIRTKGKILAIEPNPEVGRYLEMNLAAHGAGTVQVRQVALFREAGEMSLHLGDQGRSGYSSLVNASVSDVSVTVPVTTLDRLLAEEPLARVDFMKIDVEGAEIDVLAGAHASVEKGCLPLIQVEFTELNLQAAGKSTADLRAAFEGLGYVFYRMDEDSLCFEPYHFDGPVWYENLFAVMGDVAKVNQRLANAPAGQVRAARDILSRGRNAMALKSKSDRVEEAERDFGFLKSDLANKEKENDALRSDLDLASAERGRFEGLLKDQTENVDKLSATIGALEYDISAANNKIMGFEARVETLEQETAKLQQQNAKISEMLAESQALSDKRLSLLRRSHSLHLQAEDRIDNYLLRRWPLRLAFKYGIARPPIWAKPAHRTMEQDSLVARHLAEHPKSPPAERVPTKESSSQATGPRLTAILCSYNPRQDLLNWAMQSIAQQTLDRSAFEVILVDNNSTPEIGHHDFPSAQDLDVKIIREPRQGLVFARIAGIKESRAELIVFVDDDNYLAPDYFSKALEIAEREAEIGIFGGISHASLEIEVGRLKQKLLPNLGIRDYGSEPITSYEQHWGEWEPIGAGMVTRREVAEAFVTFVDQEAIAGDLGRKGKDLMSCEDSLFARIANHEGYANSYQPELSLHHFMKKERLSFPYFWKLIKGLGRSHVRLEQALGRADKLEQIPVGKLLPLLTYRLGQDGLSGAIRWAWDLGFREEMKKLEAEKGRHKT